MHTNVPLPNVPSPSEPLSIVDLALFAAPNADEANRKKSKCRMTSYH